MGHLQKFNIQKYDWVISHCNRTLTGEHESHSVDRSLTHLNKTLYNSFVFKDGKSNAKDYIDKKISDIGLRKNGVCLASWVFQPTDEVKKEDYMKFFESISAFMVKKYGDNWIRTDIHYDEPDAKPHSHNLIVPIKDGKFRAKQIFTKKELLSFHDELSNWVSSKEYGLGYPVHLKNGATIRDAKGKPITVSKYNSIKHENEELTNKINDISTFEKERKETLKVSDPRSYNALISAEKKVLQARPTLAKRIISWLNNIFHKKPQDVKVKELDKSR